MNFVCYDGPSISAFQMAISYGHLSDFNSNDWSLQYSWLDNTNCEAPYPPISRSSFLGPRILLITLYEFHSRHESAAAFLCIESHKLHNYTFFKPGLWSWYTQLPTPTPTPQFLKLQLLHKGSICINNGKPIRHFITTTCIIKLLFRHITYI
jgi:hypothetical protein